MDAANRPEEKLQTFAGRQYSKQVASLKMPSVIPPSTKKMDAAMQLRRYELEQKLF